MQFIDKEDLIKITMKSAMHINHVAKCQIRCSRAQTWHFAFFFLLIPCIVIQIRTEIIVDIVITEN